MVSASEDVLLSLHLQCCLSENLKTSRTRAAFNKTIEKCKRGIKLMKCRIRKKKSVLKAGCYVNLKYRADNVLTDHELPATHFHLRPSKLYHWTIFTATATFEIKTNFAIDIRQPNVCSHIAQQ